MPSDRPNPARMKLNSPICASDNPIATAVPRDCPSPRTTPIASSGLATSTISTAASAGGQCASTSRGLNSMPAETKNSTANASRSGMASMAARSPNSDCPTTIPARNAPRAIETPKPRAEPTAMPSAITSTVSVNSSRDRVAATRSSTQGMNRPPPTSVSKTSVTNLSSDQPTSPSRALAEPLPPPANCGSSTSISTVSTSSTTSQPTAIRPG